MKKETWPNLYGAQTCEDEVLKAYLSENEYEFEENINRFCIKTDAGELSIAKRVSQDILNTKPPIFLGFCIKHNSRC